MRAFVAIPLPPEIRLQLDDLIRKLRSFRADVRWTAPQSIHLTLKFLGEIDPGKVPELWEPFPTCTAPG
jgi:2'-5' RNA ligase